MSGVRATDAADAAQRGRARGGDHCARCPRRRRPSAVEATRRSRFSQQTLRGRDAYAAYGTSQTWLAAIVVRRQLAQVAREGGSRVSRGTPALVHDAAAALDETGPRYERSTLLGEGGMGQVWLTRDGRIGRRVAMKIIRSDNTDASSQARFLREARVQGQLEHPAVVPVYDIGHASDGEVFFTMKRVRGNTLSDVLARLRLGDQATGDAYSLRRLLTAFSQVCLALEFAHAHGVIHRDLKPDNLMLGDHGEVYVLDWGVARVLSDDLDTDEPIATGDLIAKMAALGNRTGIVGTPGYIAPEQLKGRPIGPTADVFALGAILFEIIALRPLIADKTAIGRLEATFSGIDTAGILAELDRPISPELAALCVRATVMDPEHRLATARDMHTAIEAFLDGERDQQVRLELAERHLAAGRAAMAAGAHDLEAHKRALREVGRALAVVPDHPEARALSLQLFSSPPSASPPEVEEAIERDQAQQSRITAKNGALGMASMAFLLPILVLLGIRSWVGIGLFIAMALGAAGVSAVASRRQQRSVGLLYLVVFFNNLVFGMCAGLYGSLVLVPAMVITNTITFRAASRRVAAALRDAHRVLGRPRAGGVADLRSLAGVLHPERRRPALAAALARVPAHRDLALHHHRHAHRDRERHARRRPSARLARRSRTPRADAEVAAQPTLARRADRRTQGEAMNALRRALILGAICFFPLASAQAETGVGPAKIELASGGEKGSGLLFADLGKAFARGRHPAIVLIPEWWGLNDFVKKKAAARSPRRAT